MKSIYVNSIIEWCNDEKILLSIERVLWISPDLKEVVVIRIDEDKHLPFYRTFSEIKDALQTPYVKKINKDPFSYLLQADKEYLIKHRNKRDESWEILKEMVNLEPEIYNSNMRGELINEAMKKHGVRKKRIYHKLKQYWVGGKIVNALLPLYVNSGGAGKEKKLSNKKVGRPSKKSKGNPDLAGVNVTEEDKKIL